MKEAKRPIRVITFPERPEALLIVADALPALPAMPGPFANIQVRAALRDAGIDARVTEEVPGRWIYALRRTQADERAERAQRDKLRIATEAALATQSPDAIVRDRADVVRQKLEADESIVQLKAKIAAAKNTAATRGIYMDRDDFRSLEARLDQAKLLSQGLQGQLTVLRQREREQGAARHQQAQNRSREKAFISAARRMLDPEDFAEIWAMVDAETEGAEQADTDDAAAE